MTHGTLLMLIVPIHLSVFNCIEINVLLEEVLPLQLPHRKIPFSTLWTLRPVMQQRNILMEWLMKIAKVSSICSDTHYCVRI